MVTPGRLPRLEKRVQERSKAPPGCLGAGLFFYVPMLAEVTRKRKSAWAFKTGRGIKNEQRSSATTRRSATILGPGSSMPKLLSGVRMVCPVSGW